MGVTEAPDLLASVDWDEYSKVGHMSPSGGYSGGGAVITIAAPFPLITRIA
jgi:hypothetical protein